MKRTFTLCLLFVLTFFSVPHLRAQSSTQTVRTTATVSGYSANKPFVDITWPFGFVDTDYTASCLVQDEGTQNPATLTMQVHHVSLVTNTGMRVWLKPDSASSITRTVTLHCIAVHD